ncbi:hypothetical protein GCM10027341_36540 [Spirosoma knui]
MPGYDTLTEALDDLRKQGYTRDYNLKTDHLKCQQDALELHPEDFTIASFYRFEGMTDPDDETILYAIEEKNGQRGTLVNAYGPYADALSTEMVQKLIVRHQ